MAALKAFQQLIEEGITRVPLRGSPAELYEPLNYVLGLGGKRVRPLLTLIGCDLFDGNAEEAVDAAIAIELFHNFSLVHDDIMDNAPLRRNKETVHQKWNASTAILSGDAMLIKAYEQLAKTPPHCLVPVFQLFNQTALEVCEGQQLDMNFEKQSRVSIPQYLHMISLKTAVLLAASLQIGALIGKARAGDQERIYRFGKNMGIAFQLQDDILDVYGNPEAFGKITGGDILSNKKTYLLLKAMELAEHMPYRKEELMQWIHAPQFVPQEKVEAVTEIYNQLNVRSLAEQETKKYYELAVSELQHIPADEGKKAALQTLAESLLNRTH